METYTQFQFEVMEDPKYIDKDLLEIFSSTFLDEDYIDPSGLAEFGIRIAGRLYELFPATPTSYELDGPGIRDNIMVKNFNSDLETVRAVCRVVLEYTAGRLGDDSFVDLAS